MAAWNLALRFLLEVAALVGLGVLAWRLGPDGWRWLLVVVVPGLAAVGWALFNVAGDPSRSGRAPVPVDGTIRLALEIAILAAGALGLWQWNPAGGVVDAALVLFHYAVSWERIRWLVA